MYVSYTYDGLKRLSSSSYSYDVNDATGFSNSVYYGYYAGDDSAQQTT